MGDQILFSWTTPANTPDGEEVKGPIDAVLCLEETPVSASSAACRPLLRFRVVPGPGRASLPLAPKELHPPAALLRYRMELQNAHGRSAGLSAPCLAASGPAPPPVGPLTVNARPEGALITWQRTPSPALIEVRRTNLASAATAKLAARRQPTFEKTSSEVLLRPETSAEVSGSSADPGGLLDRTLRDPRIDGTPFVYIAQRIETVTLEGHTLELRGEPSPPTSFTFHDSFPPATPTGLQAVPTRTPPAIDLAWESVIDPALAGYNLYRAGPEGGFVRVNKALLPAPAYRDLNVVAGTSYRYRVTAMDVHGNESARSAEVRERVPQP